MKAKSRHISARIGKDANAALETLTAATGESEGKTIAAALKLAGELWIHYVHGNHKSAHAEWRKWCELNARAEARHALELRHQAELKALNKKPA